VTSVAVGLDQAAAYLTDHFGSGVSSVEPIGEGDWSRAYALTVDGRELVARFGAHLDDFQKDRLAALWEGPDLPIPQVEQIVEAPGGWCCLSKRLRGEFLDELPGDEMAAALPSLFATLDTMRAVDLSATTGYGGWGGDGQGFHPSWRAYLSDRRDGPSGERLTGWREALVSSPTGIRPFNEVAEVLDQLIPFCPEERHVIHSDLLHLNVLVDGPRVSAVLDWGCSLYGDFLYDLAWLAFCSPWFPAWSAIDWHAEGARHLADIGVPVPDYAERMRAYELHIGLDGMRYNAFRCRHDVLASVAAQTLAVARG